MIDGRELAQVLVRERLKQGVVLLVLALVVLAVLLEVL